MNRIEQIMKTLGFERKSLTDSIPERASGMDNFEVKEYTSIWFENNQESDLPELITESSIIDIIEEIKKQLLSEVREETGYTCKCGITTYKDNCVQEPTMWCEHCGKSLWEAKVSHRAHIY